METATKNRFSGSFDRYACEGDTISAEIDGLTVTARIEHDRDSHIDDDDAHNPDQRVTGCGEEEQEKLLHARKAWRNNEWFYCGIVLSVCKAGVTLDNYCASLWGIECNYPGSDNAYLTEVANELLDEAISSAETILAKLR